MFWSPQKKCVQSPTPELWDTSTWPENSSPLAAARARALCADCPMTRECAIDRLASISMRRGEIEDGMVWCGVPSPLYPADHRKHATHVYSVAVQSGMSEDEAAATVFELLPKRALRSLRPAAPLIAMGELFTATGGKLTDIITNSDGTRHEWIAELFGPMPPVFVTARVWGLCVERFERHAPTFHLPKFQRLLHPETAMLAAGEILGEAA